jgi:hypothetical protein
MSFSQKRIQRFRVPNRMQRCLRLLEMMQHMKITVPPSVAYQEVMRRTAGTASVELLSDFKTLEEIRTHLEECKKVSSPTVRTRCIVCFRKERKYVLGPCGHYKLCHECVQKVSSCPICRTHIVHRIKVFE